MPPALGTFPELLGGPRVFRQRIPELHLVAAPLAADLDLDVVHGRILSRESRLG